VADIADVTAAAADAVDALHRAVVAVCRRTPWTLGHVYLADDTGSGWFRSTGTWHYDGDRRRVERFCALVDGEPVERGRGLCGRAAATGRTQWISDIARERGFPEAATTFGLRDGLGAAVAVPVVVVGEPVAVLEFFAEQRFDPEPVFLSAAVGVAGLLARRLEQDHRPGHGLFARGTSGEEERLRRALEDGEFRLVYQPKVSLSTDRIVGVEALLRWEDPERGQVGPDRFIPLAESTGLIVPIGAHVLREAFRQAVSWLGAYPRSGPFTVAVNVSARQFRAGLLETVEAAVVDTGVDPHVVCLELTESTVMQDVEAAAAVLADLRALGVGVSIDDFGTGYSSLAYLRRFPLDEVKIDKSFVDGLGTDAEATAVVAAVVSLAHALERDVVAEGVETVDQLERLRSLGCDYAQGYLFARPVPASSIDALLADDAVGGQVLLERAGRHDERHGAGETVVVADDDPTMRRYVRMSLTAAGCTVEEAGDGTEAVAAVRRVRPDCIVLDVTMPDMSGLAVCAALRADPETRDTTIVMLTSHDQAIDKVEAFAAGADDYIVKPFAPRDLVARVRIAVRRRRTA
jgi:EAL domain-containing protein (putative c-di-GMP-specific phosphodiesterase class I)/CheY-like chemotaxis protein